MNRRLDYFYKKMMLLQNKKLISNSGLWAAEQHESDGISWGQKVFS